MCKSTIVRYLYLHKYTTCSLSTVRTNHMIEHQPAWPHTTTEPEEASAAALRKPESMQRTTIAPPPRSPTDTTSAGRQAGTTSRLEKGMCDRVSGED
ncbi:hypothetical protein KC19_2G143900 [Ceratodon purpureus]|uniref:Uncharacterized protein n=1 Tax=Ceratodon purpureus TaxID=3225 RepID=A0A8T0IVH7_CERPU|nr:hypothetical protein KC19_2G143900 [Ceratodon purpureus]